MPRRRFRFDRPDRFVAGTVGAPGSRAFFLQATDGGRTTSVSLEKVQVALLAQRLGELLDDLARRGVEGAGSPAERPVDRQGAADLAEPLNEAFRAGTLSLGWDPGERLVLLEARAITDDEDEDAAEDAFEDVDDEDGPDLLLVRLEPAAARTFAEGAARVVAAGRPPCPLCGQPLDPQGHLCPRRNGHRLH